MSILIFVCAIWNTTLNSRSINSPAYLTSISGQLLGIPVWIYPKKLSSWSCSYPKFVLPSAIPFSVSGNSFLPVYYAKILDSPFTSLSLIITHQFGYQILWAPLSKYIQNPNNSLISLTASNLVQVTIIPFLDYFSWLPPLYLSLIFVGHNILNISASVGELLKIKIKPINILQGLSISLRVKNQSPFIAYKGLVDFWLHLFYPLVLAQSMPAMPCSFSRIWTCCFLFWKVFLPDIYPYGWLPYLL